MARLAAAIAPRYRVDRIIARGGMACVFKGFNTSLQVPVALKVLEPDIATVETVMRFEREGRVQAQLQNAHIVRVNDSLEYPGLRVLVEEFVDGPSLKDVLAERRKLPVGVVRRIGLQLLEALQCAHEAGVVHRDVKPGNILLRKGQALLADFGIASVAGDETLTHPGQAIFTPAYASPEQMQKRGPVDRRSDLYSLGLTLRQCLLGLPDDKVRDPGTNAWRGIRSDIRGVIERSLAVNLEERWQSANEFKTALEKTSEPLMRRWRPAFAAMGLSLAIILVAFFWQPSPPPPPPPPPRTYDFALVQFAGPDSAEAARLTGMVVHDLEWVTLKKVMPTVQQGDSAPPSNYFAEGRVERAGDSLRVTAYVRDSAGQPYQSLTVTGNALQPQRLAYDVARGIFCKTFRQDCIYFPPEAIHEGDKQAVEEFFKGKDSVAKGNWAAGERHFQASLDLDPGYMPAAWELMITKRFRRELYGENLLFIARNIDSLPDFYRRLAVASLTPDLRERLRLYNQVVSYSQRNGTALLMFTNELFHRGALIGVPLDSTVQLLRTLAEREPDMNHASTYDMIWWGALRLGLESVAREALARREALGLPPGDTYKPFQELGLDARFHPWRAEVRRFFLLRLLDDETLRLLARYTRLGHDDGRAE